MDVKKYYNLPDEVKFCKTCGVTNQRPRLKFNEEGNCNVCRYNKLKHAEIDWNDREEKLKRLLDKYRRNDGSFDVVVPFSGGKDSCFVAHRLKTHYGMHPLTVTFAPHIYTDIGWQNIQSAIRSGFYNITVYADGQVHRRMTRLAFEHMGDSFLPFIYGQQALPLQIAVNYEIPLIMYGENGQVEYEGAEEFIDKSDYEPAEQSVRMFCSGFHPSFWKKFGLTDRELFPYQLPSSEKIKKTE